MEAIGQLTGGIAHDFNNILQGIIGYLALAEERAGRAGDDRLGRYLEQRAPVVAARARPDPADAHLQPRPARRAPAVLARRRWSREALKLLRSSLPATLELETELDDALPAVARDPVQVEQVLLNLCINARDAMERRRA